MDLIPAYPFNVKITGDVNSYFTFSNVLIVFINLRHVFFFGEAVQFMSYNYDIS